MIRKALFRSCGEELSASKTSDMTPMAGRTVGVGLDKTRSAPKTGAREARKSHDRDKIEEDGNDGSGSGLRFSTSADSARSGFRPEGAGVSARRRCASFVVVHERLGKTLHVQHHRHSGSAARLHCRRYKHQDGSNYMYLNE